MKQKDKAQPAFDLKAFLTDANEITRTTATHDENRIIYSQGDPADAIFYIHKGKVKLTVVSRQGKEAVVGLLGAGDFFGEGCLAGRLNAWGPPPPFRRAQSCGWRRRM